MKSLLFVLCAVALFANFRSANCKDIVEAISEIGVLSTFKKHIDKVSWGNEYLASEGITLFAPTNAAFTSYQAINKKMNIDDSGIFNRHVVSSVVTTEDFPGKISSIVNFPDLWLGLINDTLNNKLEYMVQNARIINIMNQTDLQTKSKSPKVQKLYIIDKVLQVISKKVYTAWDLIKKSEDFGIAESFVGFTDRVSRYSAEDLFDGSKNPSTFLIPLGNNSLKHFNKVDRMLLGGHVIPDKVLFTRQLQNGFFKSEMYDKEVKIDLSFSEAVTSRNANSPSEVMVKSHTEVGNIFARNANGPKHGTVLSKLIMHLSDIPVSNGVVHIIDAPLVVSTTILENIENYKPASRTFLEILKKTVSFDQLLIGPASLTVFLPTNDAFEKIPKEKLDEIINDEIKLENMLHMHIVPSTLYFENFATVHSVKTITMEETIYFDINKENGVLTVEGGGSNATAIETDISATNGVVHVINQVLGVPLSNTFEKLRTDGKLRTTFQLGEITSWNNQFNRSSEVFTFFAPNEHAWQTFNSVHPTIYHSLLADEQPKEIVDKILQGYLVKGEILSSNQVLSDSADNSLHIGTSHSNWNNNKQIQFSRLNVRTTNGVIHIIDDVMLLPFTTLHGILCHTENLSTTYELGEKITWNDRFKDVDKRFTYFVPNNKPWNKYKIENPKQFEKLMSGNIQVVSKILGRLVVEGSFTIDKMLATFRLKTIGGDELMIHKYPNEKRVWLQWMNIRVEITEYDILTTNGVIHIINKVLISKDDVKFSVASSALPTATMFVIAGTFAILLL